MSTDWAKVPLGDVAQEVTVGHVGPMASEYIPIGIPFLRSQNVLPHKIDLSDVRYISPDFHARLRKSALKPGDVVTVRTGKPGATAVVPESLAIANCSDLVITRPGSQLDSRWLSYYINGAATGFVSSRLVGAVQQHFNVGAAKEMQLALPQLAEQRGIAATLGALDDKIESNRRAIQIASDLLDALSAALADTVQSVRLGNLVTVERAAVDPTFLADVQVAHFSLPAFDDGARPDWVTASTIMSGKLAVTKPSILVSRLNPRFNRTWWAVPTEGVPALASTEFACLTTDTREDLAAVWLAVRDEYFRAELVRRASGTSGSHQRVRPDDLLAIDVPDVRELSPSAKVEALALIDLMHDHRIQSLRLARLRDTLLPELLSGRIRVPEAHEAVAETAVSV